MSEDVPPKMYKVLSIPCVYVRYSEEEDFYYIGQTKCLQVRYRQYKIPEIFYFEIIEDVNKRLLREKELIEDFLEAGLPLANRQMPYPFLRKEVIERMNLS